MRLGWDSERVVTQSNIIAHLLDQGCHVQRVIWHAPRPPAEPCAVIPLRRPHLARRDAS